MSRGILYCAIGQRYLAEAIASARSSLRYNKIAHVIFTDCAAPEAIAGVEFREQEASGQPFADKIATMSKSPYSETIHLDTDTHVAADLTGLFDILARFDVATAHAPGYVGEDPEVPEIFYELNSGVIAFRGSPAVKRFLGDWRATYLAWLENPPFERAARGQGGDQPALRRSLWKSDLSVYIIGPEYNYRTIQPGRLVGRIKIIHGRAENYEALVARLNEWTGPRIFPIFSAW
jgi:hypothetical protein